MSRYPESSLCGFYIPHCIIAVAQTHVGSQIVRPAGKRVLVPFLCSLPLPCLLKPRYSRNIGILRGGGGEPGRGNTNMRFWGRSCRNCITPCPRTCGVIPFFSLPLWPVLGILSLRLASPHFPSLPPMDTSNLRIKVIHHGQLGPLIPRHLATLYAYREVISNPVSVPDLPVTAVFR